MYETVAIVIERHFMPMLAMFRDAITATPEYLFQEETVGIREHVYHALYGLAILLEKEPEHFSEHQQFEVAARKFGTPASGQVTRDYLLVLLASIEKKFQALLVEGDDLLKKKTVFNQEATLLDQCLSQVRHGHQHLGAIDEILRLNSEQTLYWHSFVND